MYKPKSDIYQKWTEICTVCLGLHVCRPQISFFFLSGPSSSVVVSSLMTEARSLAGPRLCVPSSALVFPSGSLTRPRAMIFPSVGSWVLQVHQVTSGTMDLGWGRLLQYNYSWCLWFLFARVSTPSSCRMCTRSSMGVCHKGGGGPPGGSSTSSPVSWRSTEVHPCPRDICMALSVPWRWLEASSLVRGWSLASPCGPSALWLLAPCLSRGTTW